MQLIQHYQSITFLPLDTTTAATGTTSEYTNLPVDTTNNNNINISNVGLGEQRVARYVRDTNCSCTSCTLRSSGSAEIKKWQVSDVKAHLRDLLSNDKQHRYWHDPPAMVYDDNRALFHLYKYKNFSNNIRSLKKAITSERDSIDFDEVAVVCLTKGTINKSQ